MGLEVNEGPETGGLRGKGSMIMSLWDTGSSSLRSLILFAGCGFPLILVQKLMEKMGVFLEWSAFIL